MVPLDDENIELVDRTATTGSAGGRPGCSAAFVGPHAADDN